MLNVLYVILSAFTFRVRGGLRIPYTDKKFPLNKWWFAIWFTCLGCILNGWTYTYFFTMLIATMMSSQIAGWGEAVSCALGTGKPNPNRYDYYDFDEFCDNFHIGDWKLIDHPELYGVVWLTLRGVLLTFLVGLAMNNIPYMLWGCLMGGIYWLSGWLDRHVRQDGKGGWYRAEWLFGGYLGLGFVLLGG